MPEEIIITKAAIAFDDTGRSFYPNSDNGDHTGNAYAKDSVKPVTPPPIVNNITTTDTTDTSTTTTTNNANGIGTPPIVTTVSPSWLDVIKDIISGVTGQPTAAQQAQLDAQQQANDKLKNWLVAIAIVFIIGVLGYFAFKKNK